MYVAKQKYTHRYKKTNLWLLVGRGKVGQDRGVGLREA